MKTDDTLIIGWNVKEELVFVKSFNNEYQRTEMMAVLKDVQDKYPNWAIGSIETFNITEKV